MNIDPQIFFQRLIAIKDHSECSAELFQYEPCSHPQTLFDRYGLPREANKPHIAEAVGGGAGGELKVCKQKFEVTRHIS